MFNIKTQSNYLAKIIKLPAPQKHPNADKLQTVLIDFQTVITGLDAKEGQYYVYFPLECAINKEFLSETNSFEDKSLNKDSEQRGFFNKHGRVRAVRLRGVPSQGYIIPLSVLENWIINKTNWQSNGIVSIFGDDYKDLINIEFDSWDDIVICEKYVPKNLKKNTNTVNIPKHKKISRLVEGQFKLHSDTENLRKNIYKLELTDLISIHYKKHGTSFVVGNVLTNKSLSWWEKILKRLGVSINDKVYDIVYSSRKVIKNEYETKDNQHYYTQDIWGIVKDEIKDRIPKGITVYGEILGYLPDGSAIQKMDKKVYDYGCIENEHKVYIYRITFTNEDGLSFEFTDKQIEEFCEKYGFLYNDTFYYYGSVYNFLTSCVQRDFPYDERNWREKMIEYLEKTYNEKDCWMCKNLLPEEGIIVRKENMFHYEAYKLKSFRFLEGETKELDKEEKNIEDSQENTENEES